MSITDDNHKLDRILESTDLDKYELINLPTEQFGDLMHEHMGIRMARTLDIHVRSMLGLARCEGSSMKLCSGVDPCQGSALLCLPPPHCVRMSSRSQACNSNQEGYDVCGHMILFIVYSLPMILSICELF